MMHCSAQQTEVSGRITHKNTPIPFVNIVLGSSGLGTSSDENGYFIIQDVPRGEYQLHVTAVGYQPVSRKVKVSDKAVKNLSISLIAASEELEEYVITGTLKPVNRLESPVPVEVYTPAFLNKNPTPSIFEALQNVNGVRPQINCNVCNTGDIHINGLEGPYTLVLIDGMPIVSGLGTVYGLTGIPNSLIEQIEVVKGPASTLYGSEAVGGLINIITKHAPAAPEFVADAFATGYGEYNLDLGAKIGFGTSTDLMLGINYFKYDLPIDNNGDNFTDVTLQDRISIFQKWNFKRDKGR
ncbi:MAG: TonB-dependent receptor plug domain-containing protein, partial [Flavobacteriaceae bacterium]